MNYESLFLDLTGVVAFAVVAMVYMLTMLSTGPLKVHTSSRICYHYAGHATT